MTVARSNAKKINLFAYLKIFSAEVWMTFAASILLLTLGTQLVAYFSGDNFHSPSDSEEFALDNAFASVAITFLQNEYGYVPMTHKITQWSLKN